MPMPVPGTDFDPGEHPAAGDDHPVLARSAAAVLWGFDYAWESLPVDRLIRLLKSNGAQFAARYVNNAVPGGKGMMQAEADALKAAGIIIAPVYETTGTDFTGGYNAGHSAGQQAAALMRSRGAPDGSLIWFAIDTDTSDYSSTNNYLRGARAGTGAYVAQLYGKFGVCEAAASAGLGTRHWQTYAWSRGQLSSHALLYQYQNGVMIGGISMDRDRTLQQMSGPWAHSGSAPPSPQPPAASWTETLLSDLPTLAVNDSGEDVKTAQGLLKARGYDVNIDGAYGPATRSAVTAFQHSKSLAADGICGKLSWKALLNR